MNYQKLNIPSFSISMDRSYAGKKLLIHDFTSFYLSKGSEVSDNMAWFQTGMYSVSIVEEGNGQFVNGLTSFNCPSNTIFITAPTQPRKFVWLGEGKVHHFNFSEFFLLKFAGVNIRQFAQLVLEPHPIRIQPGTERYHDIISAAYALQRAEQTHSRYEKYFIANSLIRLLLNIQIAFLVPVDLVLRIKTENVMAIFMQNLDNHFDELLQQKIKVQLRVSDYARMQHLTENHFTYIVKAKSGKTTNEWIAERLCTLAKYFILRSSMSNKEIAFRLGFHHASHFSKFFKKQTSLTPMEFRKQDSCLD